MYRKSANRKVVRFITMEMITNIHVPQVNHDNYSDTFGDMGHNSEHDQESV